MNLRRIRLAIGLVAAALVSGASAQYVWTSASSGPWSQPANWLGGNAPPSGGGAGISLTFSSIGTFSYTASDDYLGPFFLNKLDFAANGSQFTGISEGSLYFVGANAGITYSGAGPMGIGQQGDITLGADLHIGGTGTGIFGIASPISESGGPASIFVDLPAAASLQFVVDNTFSGGVVLNSGSILTATPNSLGTGPLIVNGGTVRIAVALNSPILLNADLDGLASLSGSSSITAANHSAGWRNANGVVNCEASYWGPTLGDGPNLLTDLDLQAFGSFPNSSSFTFRNMEVDVVDTAASPNRLNPAAPVALDGSGIYMVGPSSGSDQRMGALSILQNSGLDLITSAGPITLRAAGLTADPSGIFGVGSSNLGSGQGADAATVFFDQPPALVGGGGLAGSTNVDILPFGCWAGNSTFGLLTYGEHGLRPLNPTTEYASSLTGNSTNNVHIATAQNVLGDVTANALLIEGSGSLSGTGTVHVTSGAIVYGTSRSNIQCNFDFAGVRGTLMVQQGYGSAISGNLSGLNGLAMEGPIQLSGNNAGLTGQLAVNGLLQFASPASLPGTGAIIGGGSEGGGALQPTMTAPYTLSRDLILHGKQFALDSTYSGNLFQMDGTISGTGGLHTVGNVRLTGNNSYAASTAVDGTLCFASDAAFGNSPLLTLNTATLVLEGDWVSNRRMLGSATLDTGPFNCTLSGIVSAGLTKIGTGSLTLNGVRLLGVNVNGGTCFFNGATLGAVNVATASGSAGTLGGTGYVGNVTLGPGGRIAPGVLGGGIFHAANLTWNGGAAAEYDLGKPSDSMALTGALLKGAAGTYAFHFHTKTSLAMGTYVLATFGSSTFSASDFTYSGLPFGMTGTFMVTANQLLFTVKRPVLNGGTHGW